MNLKKQIQGKNILANKITDQAISLLLNGERVYFSQVIQIIEGYINFVRTNSKYVEIDTCKLNKGIKIKLFKSTLTINDLFEIYNEVIDKLDLDLIVYDKLIYDKKKAVKFSPSKVS